eukprot:CAMPEP_0196636812 /NCGR_PEP_ID=MMETSP1085-20130531/56_1 /TAXON_ID=41879 ORGANISM="Pycnococcus sp, Strain CCMP1998" /NCGR_SAMPLE_ID=MMETSP1085 /ASSEMBLY_ACC=CAM_ASM_000807 /LENGTH=412 /DNA_ID=CAMNT_0041965247 /DNA_START=223 /DNA_END=1458 /DNA_ORIENTATION=-
MAQVRVADPARNLGLVIRDPLQRDGPLRGALQPAPPRSYPPPQEGHPPPGPEWSPEGPLGGTLDLVLVIIGPGEGCHLAVGSFPLVLLWHQLAQIKVVQEFAQRAVHGDVHVHALGEPLAEARDPLGLRLGGLKVAPLDPVQEIPHGHVLGNPALEHVPDGGAQLAVHQRWVAEHSGESTSKVGGPPGPSLRQPRGGAVVDAGAVHEEHGKPSQAVPDPLGDPVRVVLPEPLEIEGDGGLATGLGAAVVGALLPPLADLAEPVSNTGGAVRRGLPPPFSRPLQEGQSGAAPLARRHAPRPLHAILDALGQLGEELLPLIRGGSGCDSPQPRGHLPRLRDVSVLHRVLHPLAGWGGQVGNDLAGDVAPPRPLETPRRRRRAGGLIGGRERHQKRERREDQHEAGCLGSSDHRA